MVEPHSEFPLSQFESVQWSTGGRDGEEITETPAITPGVLANSAAVDEQGCPLMEKLSYGVHWNASSYPAWTGRQPFRDYEVEDKLPSTPSSILSPYSDTNMKKSENDDSFVKFTAPFGIDHIAAMIDQIREVFGFQFDVSVNVFELLMSQLDSRASRRYPKAALYSLHEDYISGSQSNFRKWYFASHMDQIDNENDITFKKKFSELKFPSARNSASTFNFNFSEASSHVNSPDSMSPSFTFNDYEEEEYSLESAEYLWDSHFLSCSDEERLVNLIIYLFCWTEANQVRFMPECLAFIFKCARDFYFARYPVHPQASRCYENLKPFHFLDNIITPIYKCYRSYNFMATFDGNWIPHEGDHKDFIGYDDMNQLFWFRKGIERIKVSHESLDPGTTNKFTDPRLLDLPRDQWFLALESVMWSKAFQKTYRESRSWFHNLTNFSRIWILHASVFWFYTAFNAPSLYTVGYNYLNPVSPKTFIRWTIMSLGGLIGTVTTIISLLGELRFVPRSFAGAKPVLPRLISVMIMVILLVVPAILNLTLNPWTGDDVDLMPATVISFVLFALAVLYTFYFSFQPLGSIFSGPKVGVNVQESDRIKRRYLANELFTANLPHRTRNNAILSWLMCMLIFLAKFLESYFFLTLSVRDPLRELGIMNLEEKCVGDTFLMGNFLCRFYPRIILIGVLITDMILFFLDTYLWYVIFSTVVSVSIAFERGTSIWTPWKNVYSRLPQRISTKLLAPSTNTKPHGTRAYALRVVWNSIVDSMHRNHLLSREQALRLIYISSTTQEPRFFTMEEDGKALETDKGSANAYRRISFFAQSLSTPMEPAVAVKEMPSFTVLIPHYKEKMVLGLSESIKAEMGAKITILEYLQRLYPQEWENFIQSLNYQKQRNIAWTSPLISSPSNYSMSESSSICKPSPSLKSVISKSNVPSLKSETSHQIALQKLGFSTLDPNDTERTRLWCSERTQTLYRTLKGFSNYTNALKVLYCAEDCSDQQENSMFTSDQDLREIDELCERKFCLLVAMQLYSQFTPVQLNEVETILSVVPELKVCYIEQDAPTGHFYSCIFDSSCPILQSGRRKPRLRIRLSGNPILGDGKSDNQNMAIPYYRGEYIQLVDANQDNYLEECLKIRNILMEFEADLPSSALCPVASKSYNISNTLDIEAQNELCNRSTILKPGPAPVAIVGAREYIFSENIGVLGDVAAGKEQTFGTLFSRTLAKIGAKLHYGHPDFINAIFMTTRGGVSKGQRGLHLNEDIYAGMTAVLRGGRIRHNEYYQCGKGRDLGFVSILNFTAKIGAGMGEQMLSREYFYMGTQLPFDRFIAFYYAHPGFHLNNVFIMVSLELLMMVILWISSIVSVNTICHYDPKLGPTAPHLPVGCTNIYPLFAWISRCVISIFLVFFVSLCPLLFQEFIEKGFLKSLTRIARHFGSLSMLFEFFVSRIYARSFWEDMNLGGAKYVATGRGLATSRLPFHTLYEGYYPEIISGLKSAAILIFASTTFWNLSYLWFWITTLSLCICPVLYNPHQFAFIEFFVDYKHLVYWFWNSTSSNPSSKLERNSWSLFNREIREKLTGVKTRNSNAERTRPGFLHSLISESGGAFLTLFCLGIPYLYIGHQKTSRYQEEPEKSTIIRVLFVSSISVVANIAYTFIGFLVSIILRLCKSRAHGNLIAMIVHTLSLITLIFSWWILYILESRKFQSTLLGVAVVGSVHHMVRTLITNLIVRRQREHHKTNDPWWTGDWANCQLGFKMPLIIFEEYLVKTMETLEYAYDFLTCHIILGFQIPVVLIPYIDKLHTLFLMWLRPSVTAAATRSYSVHRKHNLKVTSRKFCALFIFIMAILVVLITFPIYMPENLYETATELLERVAFL